MEHNKDHISDMEQMAGEGWILMKEMLQMEGLTEIKKDPVFKRKSIFLIAAIAASVLLFVMAVPFQWQNKNPHNAGILNTGVNEDHHTKSNIERILPTDQLDAQQSLAGAIAKKRINLNTSNVVLISPEKNEKYLDSLVRLSLKKKQLLKENEFTFADRLKIEGTRDPILPKENLSEKSTLEKETGSNNKKIKLYVGAGNNISVNNIAGNFGKINIHPSLRVVIPINEKISLHTGLYAMSAIHGKEVTKQDKELINNLSTNLLYKINTTSIIKAKYFDVPITLNYSLSPNWNIGAGVQVSQLYKVNVKEKKESYDYTNNLVESTTLRYNSNASQASAAFEKKVSIKKTEPRLVLEAGFTQKNLMITAGYYYGPSKSITLQQPDGGKEYFRNQYLKIGVQVGIR